MQKQDEVTPYDEIVEWFLVNENEIFIGDEFTNVEYEKVLNSVKPLDDLIKKYCKNIDRADHYFIKRILL